MKIQKSFICNKCKTKTILNTTSTNEVKNECLYCDSPGEIEYYPELPVSTVSAETKLKKIKGFTPGPWRECGQDRDGCSCGQIWSTTADYHLATTEMNNETGFISPETRKANASLIAYAPELYEYASSLEAENQRLRGEIKKWEALVKRQRIINNL